MPVSCVRHVYKNTASGSRLREFFIWMTTKVYPLEMFDR
jgi:hypothetical protein